MNCSKAQVLQHAWLDGELDPIQSQTFSQHLSECATCSERLEALRTLTQTIKTHATRFTPPPELFDKIRDTSFGSKIRTLDIARSMPLRWGTSGAALALAACLALFMVVKPNEQALLQDALITSHIRSLQEGHLIDVVSSDQHTVKPWFNGRIDASPPVTDLASKGFPLAGGRLDYVAGHPTAVIVYRHKDHVINLFAWPGDRAMLSVEKIEVRHGYRLRGWRDNDLEFWAVTDANPATLAEFEKLYRMQTAGLE